MNVRVWCWLWLFVSAPLLTSQELYYQMQLRGQQIGYMKVREGLKVEYQGEQAKQRQVFMVVRLEGTTGEQGSYVLHEKTMYEPDAPRNLYKYSLNYQKKSIMGKQSYTFSGNNVHVTQVLNGEKLLDRSFVLPQNIHLTTDYFSLIPFFQECQQHPLTFTTVDPKNINSPNIPSEKMSIIPLGLRVLTLAGEKVRCYAFELRSSSSHMTFWLNRAKTTILRMEQNVRNGTVIQLADSDVERKIHVDFQQPEANVPYEMDKLYRYVFSSRGKDLGVVTFSFEERTGKDEGYLLTAKGKFNKMHYESHTAYTDQMSLLSYHIQEEGKLPTEIYCEFVPGGVKERYHQKQTIDRLVPLPPKFIFWDNNSLHHLATFLLQHPLGKKQTTHAIFHPRRMIVTQGTFTLLGKSQKGYRKYQLQTPFHKILLWVSNQDHLVKYQQGNLTAVLQVEKRKQEKKP